MKLKRRSFFFLALLVVVGLLGAPRPAQGATFTVTTTADSGAGSLRDAIAQANGTAGADVIDFNIAGCLSGGCTISLLTPLPALTEQVTLDAGTQSGASCPNAPRITLSAGNATAANDAALQLTDSADGSLIRGFAITGFNGVNGRGVWFNGADNSRLECSYVGLTTSGLATGANTVGVYLGSAAANNVVGTNGDGTNDGAERNLISANTSYGVYLTDAGTSGNRIAGNYIGTKVSANEMAGNGYGVYLVNGAASNVVGTDNNSTADEVEGNLIAGNLSDGIAVVGASTIGNTFSRNQIYGNSGLGIDLNDNGVTANDAFPDSDTGGNNLMNFPVLSSGYDMGKTMSGTLTTTASTAVRVEFYASQSCDGTGNGEGQRYMGAVTGTTNGSGVLNFTTTNLMVYDGYPYTTMLATNTTLGDTSEFSACINWTPQTYTVTNTLASGAGSLADAIAQANTGPSRDTINFNIPGGSCTGPSGTCSIAVTGLSLTYPAVIDGTTQPGASCPNTPRIRLAGVTGNGLVINFGAGTSLVRGLIIVSYSTGFGINSNAPYSKLQCNFVGMEADGTTVNRNGTGVYLAPNGTGQIVGVDGDGINDAGERNLIAGQTSASFYNLWSDATSAVIAGNYIGVNLAGTASVNTANRSVRIWGANNLLGTNADGVSDVLERNVIGGSNNYLVEVGSSATGTRIAGNYIGVNATGTAGLTSLNVSYGIYVSTSTNYIGTDGDGRGDALEGNTIAFNATDGIAIADSASLTANRFSGNRIFNNGTVATSLGIELDPNGVTANDVNDVDSGANNRQNFPVMGAVTSSSGTVTVNWTFNSVPSSNFRLELYSNETCDTSGNGEGRTLRATQDVTTDGTGNVATPVAFSVPATAGERFYTLLAIRTSGTAAQIGDTSEFSACGSYGSVNYSVTNTSDSGAGSLRQAITDANSNADFSTITFNIAGCPGGVCTINLTNDLPDITTPVFIDGLTQSGASCPDNQRIILSRVGGTNGLHLSGAGSSNSSIRGLKITGSGIIGIRMSSSSNNVLTCNHVGVGTAGSTFDSFNMGVYVNNGANNRIGTNGDGIFDALERNVIAAVNGAVTIDSAGGTGNLVAGNYLNMNSAGTSAIVATAYGGGGDTTTFWGIRIQPNANSNVIGANSGMVNPTAARNVIAARLNSYGVYLNAVSNTLVAGNYIGVNAAGTDLSTVNSPAWLGGAMYTYSVYISGGSNNVIGYFTSSLPAADQRNVISGSAQYQVFILNGSNHHVAGNYIGTNAAGTGTTNNGAGTVGVLTSGTANSVIGTNGDGTNDALEGNVITGNRQYEIYSINGSNNRVSGNIVGLNPAGTSVPHSYAISGIYIGDSTGSQIGTNGDGISDALEGNIISGGGATGVYFNIGSGNVLAGNIIGLNKAKTAALPHALGVDIFNSPNNRIGSNNDGTSDDLEANVIAGNTVRGINVDTATIGTRINRNQIYNNTDLGIDLNPTGVTANDLGDGDTGANNLQNTPVLTSVTNGGDTVSGTLNSTASRLFRLEFFGSPSCTTAVNRTGQVYLGAGTTTTDGSGNATFSISGLSTPAGMSAVTATATDTVTGDTSEFSNCVTPLLIIDHLAAATLFMDDGVHVTEGATLGDRFQIKLPFAPTSDVTVTITSLDPSRLRLLSTFYPYFTNGPSISYTFQPSNWSIPRTANFFAPENGGDPAGPEAVAVTVTITASSDPNYPVGASGQTQIALVYDPGLTLTPSGTPTLNLPTPGSRGTYTVALSGPPGLILYSGGLTNTPEKVTVGIGTITGTGTITVSPVSRTFTRANWNVAQGFEVVRLASGTMTINHVIASDIAGVATSRYGGSNPVTVTSAIVNTPADLAITHTVSPSGKHLPLGETLTYTVRLVNRGLGDASRVSLTHRLPAGVSFVSAQSAAGATCAFNSALYSVICTYAQAHSFPIGNIDTLTVQTSVSGAAGLELIAYATASALQADPNNRNNQEIPSPRNWVDGPTADIYSVDPIQGNLRRLTNDPTDDYQPDYSTDGKRVVFVSMRDGNPEIYTMNADGSSQYRLTFDRSPDLYPTWSPDGRYIVFASGRAGGGLSLYVMNANGTEVRPLGGGSEAQQPDWSPSGNQIVYIAGDGQGSFDLFTMNVDGSDIQRLTEGARAGEPVWSPDGAKIAFTSSVSGKAQLYLYENGTTRRLTNSNLEERNPSWLGADGAKMVIVSNRGGRPRPFILTLSSGVMQPLRNTTVHDSTPDWGAGRVVFARVH